MHERIDAVLFDFDHTLGVDNHLEERMLREFADRLCVVPPNDAALVAKLARFRAGEVSLEAMLTAAFQHCDLPDDVVARYKAAALSALPSLLQPMPGAIETIDALRAQQYAVGILSNGWTELQVAKARGIGFDGAVVVSEQIGVWKPDRRAFAAAAERLGVDLTRSVYVGDSPTVDVAGAKAAGMLAVWADLEGQIYPHGVTAPDRTITTLEHLVDIIRAW